MEHIVQSITVRWYNACAYYAVALARGLRDCGVRTTFVSCGDTPAAERAMEHGCEVKSLGRDVSGGPSSMLWAVSALRRYALDNGVTLVNVHHGRDHLLWALALMGTGVPLVRTSGNQIPPKRHPGTRLLMRKTAGVIATCEKIRGYYSERFGMEPSGIPVIHGGIDTGFYSPSHGKRSGRRRLGIPDEAFVFGILARFSPDKGHECFFRAAGRVAGKHPEAWFLVAGWNAQLTEADIRSMAAGAGIADRVIIAGRHPDSRDLIELLDVGVVASVGSETICRIAMEYMAMEVPVVASDTNVIPEVVRHGRSGLVVPAGDPEAMASAMCELAESRDKVRTYGKEGRRIVEEEYSLRAFAEKTLQAYGSMVHGG